MKSRLFLLFLLFSVSTYAQNLKGKVTDLQGHPIEYATIYVNESKTGCITSEKGEFILPLKQGTYTLTVQHLSYQTVTKTIVASQESLVVIKMEPKAIVLKEVKVSAKEEDKAYRIIRNVVAKSPYYQKQLLKYKTTFYAKGSMKVKEVPRLVGKLIEKEIQIRKGDVYTMESVSEVTVTPEKTEQRVISKRSSYPKKLTFETGRFGYFNIYQHTDNSFISPVTKQGLSVYRYQLEYSYRDNELLIHHIKVIPRNKSQYTYSGYIDIIDGSWHVYNFHFTGGMEYGIAKMLFSIKQNYVPIEKNVWMPGSIHVVYDAKAMGYNVIMNVSEAIQYKDYEINPILYASNPAAEVVLPAAVAEKQPIVSKKSEKLTKDITEIMEQEKLTTRDAIKLVDLIEAKNKEDRKNNPQPPNDSINPLEIQRRFFLTVDSNASLYDSSLWADYRTIPLSEEELTGFEQRRISDSIQEEKKLDPSVKKREDLRLFKNKTFSMGINPQKSVAAFNTVEGVKLGIHLYANKRFKDSASTWNNNVGFGYGFAAKHFFLYGSSQWNYNPKRFASVELFGGKRCHDFYSEERVWYLDNTVSSLFFRNNLIRYYDRTYAGLRHKIEAVNGLQTTVSLSYEQQRPLDNRSDYSFFFRKTRSYQSNVPDNEYVTHNPAYIFEQNSVIAEVSLSYTPRMFYRLSRNKKVKRYAGSKFPTFTLSWQKGINNVLGSHSQFDYLELNIAQDLNLKLFQTFKYSVSAGVFPHTKNMHFSNFKHFQSNNFWLAFNSLYGGFNTMPNYKYSTNEWFVAGHAKYETPYLMLKFLPGLNKTLITENLHLSFLTNPLTKNYIEAGYSLSKIFLVGNIGFFVGLEEFKTFYWSVQASFTLF